MYYDYCERGGLRPESEAPRVLQDVFGGHERRRPADVLCVPALALARQLPDGSRAIRAEPVCFDFAVINAIGPDHWVDTARAPGSAADKYGEGKKARGDTERLCAEAGYRFWPVIHEVQGGTSKTADSAIRAIADAVAGREGRRAEKIRSELLARVAVVVARTAATAVRKRATKQSQGHLRNRVVAQALSKEAEEDE